MPAIEHREAAGGDDVSLREVASALDVPLHGHDLARARRDLDGGTELDVVAGPDVGTGTSVRCQRQIG